MGRKLLIVFLTRAASVIFGFKEAAQECSFKKTIMLIAGYPSGRQQQDEKISEPLIGKLLASRLRQKN